MRGGDDEKQQHSCISLTKKFLFKLLKGEAQETKIDGQKLKNRQTDIQTKARRQNKLKNYQIQS